MAVPYIGWPKSYYLGMTYYGGSNMFWTRLIQIVTGLITIGVIYVCIVRIPKDIRSWKENDDERTYE